MSAFQTILFAAIIVGYVAVSVLHSYQIHKLTEEICQIYARIALL